ncbi:hypothetical protein DCAR_0626427 [Daucus carota subsp. sativus]|uniref:Epidermal patterning factor-like protein n=1 Tax=Daucus carota subsp. sativus TaxID=79200 RepID=A0AAF1B710_DAUCS|nr:hypothetical protein DCAR_0626427 [Daucus carota subsp. sativus]
MVYILRCHNNGNLIIFFIFFSVSSLPHLNFMAQVLVMRNLIGSRPPRCERKCTNCGHCRAVQVPVAPLQKKGEQETIGKLSHHIYASAAYYSRGNDISNYKPMCWKCQCGDSFYNP